MCEELWTSRTAREVHGFRSPTIWVGVLVGEVQSPNSWDDRAAGVAPDELWGTQLKTNWSESLLLPARV